MKYLLFSFLLLIPASVMAYSESVYSCGKGSTAFLFHPNIAGDQVYINGVKSSTVSDVNLTFSCYSSLVVGCDNGSDYAVSIMPIVKTSPEITFEQIASFFVGALASMAFVMASRGDI